MEILIKNLGYLEYQCYDCFVIKIHTYYFLFVFMDKIGFIGYIYLVFIK
jgi:hypothetical protein